MKSGPKAMLIAGGSSHSGKTVLTAGLIRALIRRGLKVRAAKCGPDYIDPRFLEAASGAPAINLDPFAMRPERLRALAARQAEGADLLVVEGVMGLYDGGANGLGSTASLAAHLALPTFLVVAANGMSQSTAAVAEGFARLTDGFSLAGAIVNRAGSERHQGLIREGFARASVPLIGIVPRDERLALPSRHLGLVQAEEHQTLDAVIEASAALIEKHVDLDALLRAAAPLGDNHENAAPLPPLAQKIAIADDVAFRFAYPHWLADWRAAGVEITTFSPLADEAPAEDAGAIFLPGGYPELYAGKLAAAATFKHSMGSAASKGRLVYGECGGFMTLGDALIDAEGERHEMLGLLPLVTSFAARRLHLGYRRLTPLADKPFAGPLGGHEFHYASIVSEGPAERLFDSRDAADTPLGEVGLCRGSVSGSFLHVIDRAA
ncbi:cobyrinic acid a,c-diamide synthase [Rhodopseudomonas julia]|uniref:Hydrogenobyrinate a,c-diamide synthase n=1 Tax=Rhodopseudomonas julia TaxID=200617 RepID=A0ABU0C4T3_9BRAD|nr:cobyrinate a,c-diamide synthase [Rhodopseudomonas julia]MDQ0325527.1 cobyrinic acid a,c-diamide synthase [Rhodopseudomonas julia]